MVLLYMKKKKNQVLVNKFELIWQENELNFNMYVILFNNEFELNLYLK